MAGKPRPLWRGGTAPLGVGGLQQCDKLLVGNTARVLRPVSRLLLDVPLDNFKWRPSARDHAIAWTPEVRSPERPLNLREVRLPDPSGRHALEGVDERRERNLRWVLDQEVNVVRLEVRLNQRALEVDAHLPPALPQDLENSGRDDLPPILRDEDQVSIEVVDDVPTRAKAP